ncbi:hypothetical protein [Streptomyces sp. NPDC055210]
MSMDDRPAALDAFLAAANLDEATVTAKTRAAIAPIEAKIRAAKAQERTELQTSARAQAAAQILTDAGLREAEGQHALAAYGRELADLILRLVDHEHAPTPNPPVDIRTDASIDRIPISRSVRYTVQGVPEVPDEYNETRTIAPRELTFTYRAVADSQLGRIHAYVKGWWMQDGAQVHAEAVGRHFHGDPAKWPERLAAEAQLFDPERPTTAGLREAASMIEARQERLDAEERADFGRLDHETVLQGAAVRDMAEHLRKQADQTQAKPWLSDSARIGHALIWSWTEAREGAFGDGYRAAQAEARAILTGERGEQYPVSTPS